MRPAQNLSRRRGASAALIIALCVPALAGCALLEGPTPETPERSVPKAPEVKPEFVPDGTAEQNLPYFTEVIREFAAGKQAVQGEPVADAVIDAGFDPEFMQVSFDRTKTDLEADNIFVSVRIDDECLIGQIVAVDRSFAVSDEPAVGPDADLCLIGETRPIDWR